jgi:IclR family acetate operon transcriptional repressor
MLILHLSDIHFHHPICNADRDPDRPFRTRLMQDAMGRLPRRAREKLLRSLDLLRYTDGTIADPERLLAEVEITRKRGWAKSNEEFVRGVVGCAVPIFGPGDVLIACLGVSVPAPRVSFEELDAIIPPLQAAAARLSRAIIDDESDNQTEDTNGAGMNSAA